MFRQNRTAKWLKSKDDQEKKMFKACIRVGRDQRQLYKQHKNNILVYQQNVIQEKQALAKKRRQKEERQLVLCAKISHNGLWMSTEDAVTNLSKLSNETQKKAALKYQLKFRKIILCQEYADTSVFQFSKAKKQYSSQKLLDNLCSGVPRGVLRVLEHPHQLWHNNLHNSQVSCSVTTIDTDNR